MFDSLIFYLFIYFFFLFFVSSETVSNKPNVANAVLDVDLTKLFGST